MSHSCNAEFKPCAPGEASSGEVQLTIAGSEVCPVLQAPAVIQS